MSRPKTAAPRTAATGRVAFKAAVPKTDIAAADAEIRAAVAWLEAEAVPYVRHTRHHLKIADVNYYPTTGTIAFDGFRKPHPERGLAALQGVVRRLGLLPSAWAAGPRRPSAIPKAAAPQTIAVVRRGR